MTTQKTILFLCPHAAAKSVLAMTYFDNLAGKAGLKMIVSNAGTEPDPAINPAVEAYLHQEGFDLAGFVPRLLTQVDLESANIIVSMGCISAEQVPAGVRFLDWSAIPMPSDGFQTARNSIYTHVVNLVAELSQDTE